MIRSCSSPRHWPRETPAKNALLSLALLCLSCGFALFPGTRQRLLKLPVSGRLCLCSGFAGGEFSLKRRFACSLFSGFFGCLLGRFPRAARLFGGPAFRDPGLSGSDDCSTSLLTLCKFGIGELGAVLFDQLFFGVYDGFLSFGGTQFVQRWNPSIVRGANSQTRGYFPVHRPQHSYAAAARWPVDDSPPSAVEYPSVTFGGSTCRGPVGRVSCASVWCRARSICRPRRPARNPSGCTRCGCRLPDSRNLQKGTTKRRPRRALLVDTEVANPTPRRMNGKNRQDQQCGSHFNPLRATPARPLSATRSTKATSSSVGDSVEKVGIARDWGR